MKNNKAQSIFSNLIILVIFLIVVSVAGLLAGIIYYDMALLETELLKVDFALPIQNNNTASSLNMTTFQDILGVVIYPLLGLKDTLPYLTYFMIFGFIIAMGITAYLSNKNPVFFVVHLLFLFLITYFCIIISNKYVELLADPFINNIMLPFTIYNKLMYYLPQVVFFTGLTFGTIAFINLIKPQSSSTTPSLNYGGDY